MLETATEESTTAVVTNADIQGYLNSETGLDRLHRLFSKNDMNEYSQELIFSSQIAVNVGCIFFLMMSALGGAAARDTFIRKNKATLHETKFTASRAYYDAVLFGGLRTGMVWGLKSFMFSGMFMLSSQILSVYRNKSSIYEYIFGGGITCGLLRMNLGLRGMFAGSIIGSVLGAVGGTCIYAALRLTNCTQQERHFEYIREMLWGKKENQMLSRPDQTTLSASSTTSASSSPASEQTVVS